MSKPTFYEGAERTRQVIKFAKQLSTQGADRRKLLEEAQNFNEEYNDPPLPDSDIKHLITTLNDLHKISEPYRATSLVTPDGSEVSKYAVRIITLPSGRKVTMKGTEIITVD